MHQNRVEPEESLRVLDPFLTPSTPRRPPVRRPSRRWARLYSPSAQEKLEPLCRSIGIRPGNPGKDGVITRPRKKTARGPWAVVARSHGVCPIAFSQAVIAEKPSKELHLGGHTCRPNAPTISIKLSCRPFNRTLLTRSLSSERANDVAVKSMEPKAERPDGKPVVKPKRGGSTIGSIALKFSSKKMTEERIVRESIPNVTLNVLQKPISSGKGEERSPSPIDGIQDAFGKQKGGHPSTSALEPAARGAIQENGGVPCGEKGYASLRLEIARRCPHRRVPCLVLRHPLHSIAWSCRPPPAFHYMASRRGESRLATSGIHPGELTMHATDPRLELAGAARREQAVAAAAAAEAAHLAAGAEAMVVQAFLPGPDGGGASASSTRVVSELCAPYPASSIGRASVCSAAALYCAYRLLLVPCD
ncbi:hypothetical protein HU200_062436 [Digitaria exilis]|uniref:Uncharacterized protein n=1 Tax=Digitaria exilis TaxID=1010633 RepID=A0A835ACP9_9POAL|nr:hypothetical protein HU200_062436 [Digitaria exilis]